MRNATVNVPAEVLSVMGVCVCPADQRVGPGPKEEDVPVRGLPAQSRGGVSF